MVERDPDVGIGKREPHPCCLRDRENRGGIVQDCPSDGIQRICKQCDKVGLSL